MAAGEVGVRHAHQFKIGVAEPDQPVERSEARVPAAAAGRQPHFGGDEVRGGIRIANGDDEMVDAEEHGRNVHDSGRGTSARLQASRARAMSAYDATRE